MYYFTLVIDGNDKKLTTENGISVGEQGELLTKLSKALNIKNPQFVLSGIENCCYLQKFATLDKAVFDSFQHLHQNLESQPIETLDAPEQDYGSFLKNVMKKRNVYFTASAGDWKADIKEIKAVKESDCYYISDQMISTIVGIRKKTGKYSAHIYLKDKPFRIYMSEEQEQQIKTFYDGAKIEFSIRMKVFVKTDKILHANLRKFEVVGNGSFMTKINELIATEGDLFPSIKNGQDAMQLLKMD